MLKKLATVFGVIAVAALVVSLPSFGTRASGEIAINETNFPDKYLRKDLTEKFGDSLDENEIAGTTFLSVGRNGTIRDITGLEIFTSLEGLDIGYGKLTEPDFKKFKKLKTLEISLAEIDSLDLSGMTTLTELKAYNRAIGKIDLTNCTSLNYVYLYKVSSSDVTPSIKLKGCTALTKLDIEESQIKGVDLTDLKNLETLYCTYNKLLTQIDLSNNKKLTFINLAGCSLTNIDLSKNTKVESLFLTDNNIKSLTLECPNLYRLECGAKDLHNNVLQALDISKCPKIERLSCKYCSIDTIYAPKPKDDLYDLDLTGTDAEWKVVIQIEVTFERSSWIGDEKNGYTGIKVVYRYTTVGISSVVSEKVYDISSTKVVAPTCTEKGYTVYTVVIPASEAPDKKEFKASTKGKYTDAKGHSWGKWTVSKKGSAAVAGLETRTCSACKKQEKRNSTPAYVICGNTLTLNKILEGTSKWVSSDKKIATVDSSGKITGKMAGTVTITETAGSKTSTVKVTVLYKDVTDPDSFWFTPAYVLTDKGIVKGYDKQTRFKPSYKCTRGQMVTFIWRLAGQPEPKSKKCKFSDVKETDYFYKACIWGNEKGIVEGYKNGTFGPGIICARRHAVTFLWRYAGKPDPKSTKSTKFTDISSKDYFYKATLWASEKKILEGYDDNTFRPNGVCLRRQMVTFLYKFDKYVNQGK